MDKVLTVSIAAYNVESYLAETLESLAVSCLEQLDVVVVNDGSRDNTSAIARSFCEKYPASFRVIDKENGGYGSTHNASLKIAKGKYFKFLDGDDWFDGDQLTRLIDVLNETEADAVITPYVRVFTDEGYREQVVDDISEYAEGRYLVSEVVPVKPIAACSLTYRTDLLRSCEFRMSEHMFYTDIEYAYLPWIKVETYQVSKLPVYRYRLGREGQSVSREGISAHYSDICDVCARLLSVFAGENVREFPARAYINTCLVKEVATAYLYLCRAKASAQVACKLREWDLVVRAYPQISGEVERKSKLVRFLRASGLHGYRLAAWLKGRDLG